MKTWMLRRILGLQMSKNPDGTRMWTRSKVNWKELHSSNYSRRELFSICGKLTCYYPVAGWLRLACSTLKRACPGNYMVNESRSRSVKEVECHIEPS